MPSDAVRQFDEAVITQFVIALEESVLLERLKILTDDKRREWLGQHFTRAVAAAVRLNNTEGRP